MNRLTRISLASLALGSTLALDGCADSHAADAAPARPPAVASARTPWVHARAADGVSLLEAPAVVLTAPDGVALVGAPFRARVARIAVKAGSRVARGQVIVEVVMPDVTQAAGAWAAAATRVEAYARRSAQLEALKRDGLVKLADQLEAETRLAEARADQQRALATLRAADVRGEDALRLLAGSGQVALRSPIAGVVTELKVALGETREPGGDPMARIAADGEGRLEARFAHAPPPDALFDLLLPDGTHHALVLLGRAPVVDARDGTTPAWFAPASPRVRLPAGLAGRVAVRLPGAAAAVPARAVALDGSRAFVIVNRAGAPLRVDVEVLATSGADALVRGAVTPGDEVAADATLAETGS